MEYDVVIVGAGAMGSAAAMHCAWRGARVAVVEQHTCGHSLGSSHGHSRVIRQAYFEHPDYVPLLLRSYDLFRELERRTGTTLLVTCGGLFAGRPDSEVVAGSRAAARRHGIPVESLDPAALRERFPQFELPPEYEAVFEPGAGFVRPEATIDAQLTVARGSLAVVMESVRTLGWSRDRDLVIVETDKGEVRGRSLIVTAGAWTRCLLDPSKKVPMLPVRPTRQPLVWVEPRPEDRSRHTAPTLPVWIVDHGDGYAPYGIPPHPAIDGPRGMKAALHGPGTAVDPDRVDRVVSEAEAAAIAASVARILPHAVATTSATAVCMYTYSPDSHFIVDSLGDGVHVACGFSGHGFKFAPVIGEALADLALNGRTSLPIEFLSLRRFGRSPLQERRTVG